MVTQAATVHLISMDTERMGAVIRGSENQTDRSRKTQRRADRQEKEEPEKNVFKHNKREENDSKCTKKLDLGE